MNMLRRVTNDLSRTAGPMLAAWLLLAIGPDIAIFAGRPEVSLWITGAAVALFGAGLSHVLRRLWLPYVELAALFRKAGESPVGAGLGALGVCILLSAILLSLTSAAKAQPLPGDAARLLPVLQAEQRAHWPDMPAPRHLAAQVEQESRWRPDARLHTAREDGYGLGQFTVTARFNAVAEIIAMHPRELAGWGMANVLDPVFQLRAVVLKDRTLWRGIEGAATADDRFAFVLAAYNGGAGSVAKRRTLCRGAAGCDPGRWWGHAERYAPQARTAQAGYGKSFADINTEYPSLVMVTRAPKYVGRI